MSVCEELKKIPKQNFSHLPSRGHHHICQLKETTLMTKWNGLCFSSFFLGGGGVFYCDTKVLNGKYINYHVIHFYTYDVMIFAYFSNKILSYKKTQISSGEVFQLKVCKQTNKNYSTRLFSGYIQSGLLYTLQT